MVDPLPTLGTRLTVESVDGNRSNEPSAEKASPLRVDTQVCSNAGPGADGGRFRVGLTRRRPWQPPVAHTGCGVERFSHSDFGGMTVSDIVGVVRLIKRQRHPVESRPVSAHLSTLGARDVGGDPVEPRQRRVPFQFNVSSSPSLQERDRSQILGNRPVRPKAQSRFP